MDKTKGSNGGSGVYALVNRTNGRMYIGSSKNFYNRIKIHKSNLRLGKHNNKELQNDYNEGHNIDFVVLEQCEISSCLLIERKFISFFEDFVYNLQMKSKAEKAISARKTTDLRDYWNKPAQIKRAGVKAVSIRKKKIRVTSPPREACLSGTHAPVNQLCAKTGRVIASYPSMNSAANAVGTLRQNIYSSVKYGGIAAGFRWVRA